jgi:glycosyltransferase involved in cell wall biosynthesis
MFSKFIHTFSIIGESNKLAPFQQAVQQAGITCHVLGFSSRGRVFEVLCKAHMLWLPSLGEGFQMVMAVAWSHGCIPITSDVSSLSQYVHHGINGFIWTLHGAIPFVDVLAKALPRMALDSDGIAQQVWKSSQVFFRSSYRERILRELIDA